jgi:hypothetical protein
MYYNAPGLLLILLGELPFLHNLFPKQHLTSVFQSAGAESEKNPARETYLTKMIKRGKVYYNGIYTFS